MPMPSTSSQAIKVLLIDDDAAYGKLVGSHLDCARLGTYVVDVAVSLAQGRERLSQGSYDVILLDLGLPDSSGIDTLFQLIREIKTVPILVLTGSADETTGMQALRHGAQDYLHKDDISGILLERSIRYTLERFNHLAMLKEKEAALLESEHRFRDMIENSQDAFLVVDEAGIAMYMNPAAEALFGRPADQFIGEHVSFPIPPETPSEVEIIKSNKDKVVAELRAASVVLTAAQWDGRRVHLINFRDITQRKQVEAKLKQASALLEERVQQRTRSLAETNRRLRHEIEERRQSEKKRLALEQQLMQAARMEAVGTMAGGLAHLINNQLAVIIGNVEMLAEDLAANKALMDLIEPVLQSAQQISRMTDLFMAHAKEGNFSPGPMELGQYLSDTLPLIQLSLPYDIDLKTHWEKGSYCVQADRAQLHLLLSAVLNNACEANKGGGRVDFKMRRQSLERAFCEQHPGSRPGRYILMTITDKGEGMNRETVQRIFEPFYTTRFQGRGLGMAAAYGIVKTHEGYIWVESSLGSGTEVQIYLPEQA